jgi:hypothetical protein
VFYVLGTPERAEEDAEGAEKPDRFTGYSIVKELAAVALCRDDLQT